MGVPVAVAKPMFFYANGTTTQLDVLGHIVGLNGDGVMFASTFPQTIPSWNGTTLIYTQPHGLFDDPFPLLLDPSIWDFQRVSYPAAIFPMNASVNAGVTDLINKINSHSGPFALGGYSQGAITTSIVLNEIRYGTLNHRLNDLIAGITFGNPLREVNHAWPGAKTNGSWDVVNSTTGGHGCMPVSQRLTNTPDWWWDFAEPNDIIASTGDSGIGLAWQGGAGLFSGLNSLLGGDLFSVLNLLNPIFLIQGLQALSAVGSVGHMSYPVSPPFGYPADSPTAYLIAAKHLNDVGAAWRAKQTPAAPVVSLPSTGSSTPSTGQIAPAGAPFTWLSTLLADGTNAVEAALGAVFSGGGAAQLEKDLQTLISQSSDSVSAALNPILKNLQLGAPVTTVLTQLQNYFGTANASLSAWWNSQINGWYQQLTTFVGQSDTWLQNLLTQGTQVVEDVLGNVLTTGQHALESVVNQFANGLSAANADLQGLLKSVVTAVQNGSATLHDAISSLDAIAKNGNLFSGAADQLNNWWNSTVETWFKNVKDIFGLPVSSAPVDKQQPTPIATTDPVYQPIRTDIGSLVTSVPSFPAVGPVADARKAITGSDPLAASKAAWEIAQAQQVPDTRIAVTFYDKTYNVVGECNDYKNLTYTFARNQIGTGTLVLKQTDPLVPVVMKCHEEVIPVTIGNGSLRWSGRVEYVDYQFKDGQYDVTVYLTDDYQWFDRILCWPNFLLPIQTQFPQRSLFIGPAITCIKTLIAEQCFRLQSGLWEFVNTLGSGSLDWQAWFGTLLQSDGDPIKMLMTPIVVLPTNPLFDTSPWTSINGRMDKISTLVEQVVKDCGLVLTANLWLPGDPQPDGLVIPLYAPTILVDVKDMSGITGPTGTFIDGIVTDVVDLQHGVLGDTLSPFLNPANSYAPEGINIAPLLGVNFEKPWVLFHDHPRSGLREFHLTPHHPISHTIIGGGKSPKWVNDLINATLEWMIELSMTLSSHFS